LLVIETMMMMTMILCGLKHVEILSVILQYITKNNVQFVG